MKSAYIIEIIKPLWNTNWLRVAVRLYDSLPCHKINFFRSPNFFREKSDASDAYIPSLPSMPIPTSASKIMPTSLPPSPTAAIRFPLVYFFNNFATSAF